MNKAPGTTVMTMMNGLEAGEHRELRLELFGGPRLRRGETPIRLSPQEMTMTAIIGASGREGVDRDDLLDYLWNSGRQEALRSRLAQAILMVRQKVGTYDFIVARDRRLALNRHLVSTDLEDLSRALGAGRLGEAISLVAAGFLPNVRGAETHQLTSWLEERQVHFRGTVRRELGRAVQEAHDRANFEEVARLAALQLELDPEDESALRRLLRAYGAQGRAVEGRAAFVRFTEGMASRDPDWKPTERTLDAFSSLGSISVDTPWVRQHLRRVGPRFNPFHGREGHHSVLTGLLDAESEDSPKLIFITGEPGMGRSRTIHEVLLDIASSGITILFAIAEGGQYGQSLQPFSQAFAHHDLTSVLPHLDQSTHDILLHTVVGYDLGGVSSIISDHTTVTVPFASVCEAILRLLTAWTSRQRLVLAIDDAHLADVDSLNLLTYLLRRGLPQGLSLLLSVDGSHSRARQVIGLGDPYISSLDIYVLPLDPLSEDSLEHIGHHFLSHDCAGEVINTLVALSRGSPKRMIMLCQRLRDGLRQGNDVPTSLSHLISHHYGLVTDTGRRILALLAVADGPLSLEAIPAILSLSPTDVAAISSSQLKGWVRPQGTELSFPTPLLSRLLYESLSEHQKRRLHFALATYLEDAGDYGRSHQIARHFALSGEEEKASIWIERALRASSQGYDAEPAVSLAVETIGNLDAPVLKSRLLFALGGHQLGQGKIELALTNMQAARALLNSNHLERDLIRQVEVSLVEGKCLTHNRAAGTLLAEIIGLRQTLLHEGRWDLLARVCRAQLRLVDSGGAPEIEEEIMSWVGQLLKEGEEPLSANMLPLALVYGSQLRKGFSEEAYRVLSDAMPLLEEQQHAPLLAYALQLRFMMFYHRGLLNTADGIAARRLYLAATSNLQDRAPLCRHHLNTAAWYIDTLDLDNAPASLSQARNLASASCPPQLAREVAVNQAELLLLQGRPHEAYTIFLENYNRSPRTDPDAGTVLSATGVAAALLRMRRPDEAAGYIPPRSLLMSRWAIDLSLLLHTHMAMITSVPEQLAFLGSCKDILSDLKACSFLWYTKTLLTVSHARSKHRLELDREAILDAATQCHDQDLRYLATRLRSLLSPQGPKGLVARS
jgi:DNA-binding SARP family transcriptional activator/tetratricopeptide (TPR) repeat protein